MRGHGPHDHPSAWAGREVNKGKSWLPIALYYIINFNVVPTGHVTTGSFAFLSSLFQIGTTPSLLYVYAILLSRTYYFISVGGMRRGLGAGGDRSRGKGGTGIDRGGQKQG